MKTYRFDESRVVVTPGNAVEMMLRAVVLANGGGKERTVSGELIRDRFSDVFDCRKIPGHTMRYWEDGGGVDYRKGGKARTSVHGVAWFPTARTRLHVRVVGERIAAPMSRDGKRGPERWGLPWNVLCDVHPLCLVYPILRISSDDERLWNAAPIHPQALREIPWDADLWWEMEEWARDHLPRIEFLRIATARVVAEMVENTFLGPAHPEY